MSIDPMDLAEEKDAGDKKGESLNSLIAVAIALLAAFIGICSIKDGNIVQNMEQAQAAKIDSWGYYQAKNIRQDVYQATADQMRLAGSTQVSPSSRSKFAGQAAAYQKLADEEKSGKGRVQTEAENAGADYNRWNFRD